MNNSPTVTTDMKTRDQERRVLESQLSRAITEVSKLQDAQENIAKLLEWARQREQHADRALTRHNAVTEALREVEGNQGEAA